MAAVRGVSAVNALGFFRDAGLESAAAAAARDGPDPALALIVPLLLEALGVL